VRDGEFFDVIVADVELGEVRGLELMRAIHELRPEQLVILITAFGSMELAAQAMREGAADFIAKPFSLDLFSAVLDRAVGARQMRREIVRLRESLELEPGNLVARSQAMERTLALAQRAAKTDATILIMGESGVGKSALARHIHESSLRSKGPFVQLNAATLPEALVESELFGVKKGAFTDARQDRDGVFQQASGGTLFLDEIAELSLAIQPKLLNALETRRVRAVGSPSEIEVDLRLIAATNQDLEQLVSSGEFREDLFYRLHIIPIQIPPLRERIEDIPAMIDHFIERTCKRMNRSIVGVSAPAMRWFCSQPWPGNARQLANTLERAIILSEHDVLTLDDFQPRLPKPDDQDTIDREGEFLQAMLSRGLTLQDLERRYIEEALKFTEGNKAETARLLAIDRKTLYRKIDAMEEDEGLS
jgi:DNA-binding NtrC family response regulator